MENRIYKELLYNRMLSTDSEIEKYKRNLELLSENFVEEDIIKLCSTFDDKTRNSEVMFGAIHLLETLSSELAYENTIIGVINIFDSSPEWAKIIVYRILNDEFSVQMIKKIYNRLELVIRDKFKLILETIKTEDYEKFGKVIDNILQRN